MRTLLKAFLLLVVVVGIVIGAAVVYFVNTGVSARPQPGTLETLLARRVRGMVIERQAKNLVNPVPRSPEVVAEGLAHFADHCASCHGNDGSGNTEVGRNLFPRAPDMRRAPTQQLSDGELFWIIENGVRFTGMPAWSTGEREGQDDSWKLVHFIRYLPNLTKADLEQMESLNPRSPEEVRQQIEEEQFLAGTDTPPAKTVHKHPGGHDE